MTAHDAAERESHEIDPLVALLKDAPQAVGDDPPN